MFDFPEKRVKPGTLTLESKDDERNNGQIIVDYQQGLYSLEHAKNNSITSDHVPILTTIQENNVNLTVVSWNVLKEKIYSGYAPTGESDPIETLDEKNARYDRIVKVLKKIMSGNSGIDFIALQEMSNFEQVKNNQLIQKINNMLDQDYSNYKMTKTTNEDCVVIYNFQKFEQNTENLQKLRDRSSNIYLFKYKNNEKNIYFYNAHMEFKKNPVNHEKEIKTFLNQVEKKNIAIVAGDFNCSTGPLHSKKSNITTSIAATALRRLEYQHKIKSIKVSRGQYNKKIDQMIEKWPDCDNSTDDDPKDCAQIYVQHNALQSLATIKQQQFNDQNKIIQNWVNKDDNTKNDKLINLKTDFIKSNSYIERKKLLQQMQ